MLALQIASQLKIATGGNICLHNIMHWPSHYHGPILQGCRFSDFFRRSDFFFFSLFSPPPLFFQCFLCACSVCVTTMRVNWWLSGQFWLRKSSSFCPPIPPIPRYFPTFLNSPNGIPDYSVVRQWVYKAWDCIHNNRLYSNSYHDKDNILNGWEANYYTWYSCNGGLIGFVFLCTKNGKCFVWS